MIFVEKGTCVPIGEDTMLFVWILNAILGCISTFCTFMNHKIEIIPMFLISYGYIFSGFAWVYLTNYFVRIRSINKYIMIFMTLILILSEHLVIYILPLDTETSYWLKFGTLLGVISQYFIYFLGQFLNHIMRRKKLPNYLCLIIIPLLILYFFQVYDFGVGIARVIILGFLCLGGMVIYYLYIAKAFNGIIKSSYVVSTISIIASIMLYAIKADLFLLKHVILFQIVLCLIISVFCYIAKLSKN